MAATDFHLAWRDQAGRVIVRDGAMRVRWRFDDLAGEDGHQLHCSFAASVRAIDQEVERKMLEESLLAGRQGVSADEIRGHFAASLRQAADELLRAMTAAVCLSDETRTRAIAAVARAGARVAFSCGLEMIAPYELTIESPTLSRQRTEQLQRQWAQDRAAEQLRQLQRSAALLDQFNQSRRSHPELSASAILSQTGAGDRGEMLHSLLAAAAAKSTAKQPLIVAGDSLLRICVNASGLSARAEIVRTALGPLRSIQSDSLDGQDVLLVGARTGVVILRSDQDGSDYQDADAGSPLGFSRALIWRGMLWACHGESGVVGWEMDNPGEPAIALRDTIRGARNLTILDDDRLLISFGPSLATVAPDGTATALPSSGATSPILAILRVGGSIVAVHENGQTVRRDAKSLEIMETRQCGGSLCAAASIPWLGESRLLLAPQSGPLQCVGLDDPLISQYASVHQGVRMLAASDQYVAAVSADRQRLILWNIWDGRKPLAELHVPSITRHRIGDVEMGG